MKLKNLRSFSKSQLLHKQQPVKRDKSPKVYASSTDIKLDQKRRKLLTLKRTLQENSNMIKKASIVQSAGNESEPRSPLQNKHTFTWMKKRYLRSVNPKYLGNQDDVRQSLFLKSIYDCLVSQSQSSLLQVADLYALMRKFSLPMNKVTIKKIFKVIDSDENGFMEAHQFKELMFSEDANDIYINFLNSDSFRENQQRQIERQKLNALFHQLQKGGGGISHSPTDKHHGNLNNLLYNSPNRAPTPNMEATPASPVSMEAISEKCQQQPLDYTPKSLGALIIYTAFLINREKLITFFMDQECEVQMQIFGLTQLFSLVKYQVGQQVQTQSKKRILRKFGIGGADSIVEYLKIQRGSTPSVYNKEPMPYSGNGGGCSPRSFGSSPTDFQLNRLNSPAQTATPPFATNQISMFQDDKVVSSAADLSGSRKISNDQIMNELANKSSSSFFSQINQEDKRRRSYLEDQDHDQQNPNAYFANQNKFQPFKPTNDLSQSQALLGKSLKSQRNSTNETQDQYMVKEYLSDRKRKQVLQKKIDEIVVKSQQKASEEIEKFLQISKIDFTSARNNNKSYVMLPFMKRKKGSENNINLSPEHKFFEFNQNTQSIIGHSSNSGINTPQNSEIDFTNNQTLKHIDLIMSMNMQRLKNTQKNLQIESLIKVPNILENQEYRQQLGDLKTVNFNQQQIGLTNPSTFQQDSQDT